MNISFKYRNKFLFQNKLILNLPQEDPDQGHGVLGQGGQDQGEPDPDPVQPLDNTQLWLGIITYYFTQLHALLAMVRTLLYTGHGEDSP